MRQILFEVDTTGSENIYNADDKKGLGPFKSTIEPSKIVDGVVQEKSTFVCKFKLKEGWKLKFKLYFALSNPQK